MSEGKSKQAVLKYEHRLCPYVVLCGAGKITTREQLSWKTRKALAEGEYVGYVDPCVRPTGHEGDHVLGTMYYAPEIEKADWKKTGECQ